jgi:hypothetical protein
MGHPAFGWVLVHPGLTVLGHSQSELSKLTSKSRLVYRKSVDCVQSVVSERIGLALDDSHSIHV